jgi:DNA repair protein RecN (Recombination protein N)
MPDAQIKIEHEAVTPQASGCDNIDVLFSANKGMAPKPLVQVASGGEFARLMFAVKFVMAERTAMPTLVLDEIDTGVSGEIALRLGKLMQAMAKNHQVIAISHLPQIAARGQAHYLVYKSTEGKKAVSHLRLLTDEERVTEIAKMIGGDKPSASALANARELMA